MPRHCNSFYSTAALCLLAGACFTLGLLMGPVVADDFPEPYNSERDKRSQPLAPAAAAARFQLPEGFRATVFAAEPDVQNPIAMTWDAQGRLWIAENYTYAERAQRFDLNLRDRVLVFTDADGDGRHDDRQVFLDDVQMLTSVEVGRGGVWLMCPPRLLFVPDADHDARPDGPAEVVLDGFKVGEDSHHNFANGLRFGPDGWLYGRCGGSCPGRIGPPGTPADQRFALEGGLWRYHPGRGTVEVLTAGTTNPWGHDWNAHYEGFFINTVNGHFWHLIPGAHHPRPFTLDPNRRAYELIDFHADHWHFDTGKSWTASRDGAANSYGGGHAHCGASIYLGDQWPEAYRGRFFTLNLHGQRANQELLERRGSGYVARHAADTALSGDPFFRGMDLSYGPDGSMFVIDWSDTGECHENSGVHRTSGRIYTIRYEPNFRPRPPAQLWGQSDLELAELHRAENEWFVRQARLVLSERADRGQLAEDAVARLRAMSRNADDPIHRLRAVATLYAADHLTSPQIGEYLNDSDEHLRTWAVRLLGDRWPLDDVFGPVAQPESRRREVARASAKWLPTLVSTAESDDSALVRLALASALQRLPVEQRPQLAGALAARGEDVGDHNLPLMIWYGLIPVGDAAPEKLVDVAKVCRLPTTRRLIARRLAEESEDRPELIDAVLADAASRKADDAATDVLAGLAAGLRGWRKAPRPTSWDRFVQRVASRGDEEAQQQVRQLSVLFGDGQALAEVRRLALDSQAEMGVRLAALETLVENRPEDLREICTPLLRDARMNVIAARGIAQYNDRAAGELLVQNYRRFRSPQRPKVIALLVSRKPFAAALLDAVASGRIPTAHLTPFDVRQILSLGDDDLTERVRQVWGEIRQTPAETRQRIAAWREKLAETSVEADLSRGRALFNRSCQKCHRLYGVGEKIGPDLTGSNRSNLDYLLENILDPSAVVSKDYRMTVVILEDGRVLNGLVTARTDRTITLQTQTERVVVNRDEIDEMEVTSQSPMPQGLFDQLSPTEVRDLVAYLRHPTQVPRTAKP